MSRKLRKLLFVQLNEINFDLVKSYLRLGMGDRLPTFNRIMELNYRETSSEDEYDNIEPWIQWVSIAVGKTYAQHGIFRLGDIAGSSLTNVYDILGDAGYTTGALSPMNTIPGRMGMKYFIKDPWTTSEEIGSVLLKKVSLAVAQCVNDNSSGKIELSSLLWLLLGLMRFARFRNYSKYLKLVLKSIRNSWARALFLDLFLSDINISLVKANLPDFATIFFNGGAHIQHHHLLSAEPIRNKALDGIPVESMSHEADPVLEMLKVYDAILGAMFELDEYDVVLATGLSQVPYDRPKYYYRLSNHVAFLGNFLAGSYKCSPRMTRDFVIEFETAAAAAEAQAVLASIRESVTGCPLFGEIDNRGTSIFVTLSFPFKIEDDMSVDSEHGPLRLIEHVNFVAVKNGMHSGKGYLFSTLSDELLPSFGAHVSEIYFSILKYFSVKDPKRSA